MRLAAMEKSLTKRSVCSPLLKRQTAFDLAQDAALLLDDRRSGKEGVLSDKDSLVHSDDVWSVTNMRNVRHTASGKGGKYAEGRADM